MILSGLPLLLGSVLATVSSSSAQQQASSSPSSPDLLNFFQISDLHIDALYSPEAGNIDYRCHANPEDSDEPHLTTTENKTDGGLSLSPAGDYACDPPMLLFESALLKMREVNRDPEFILWTGDSAPHWKNDPKFDYVYSNLRNITKLFRKYFPATPIIPALGNHDTYPADQYPDWNVRPDNATDFYSKYIEEGSWGELLDPESRDSFKKCGFYTTHFVSATGKPLRFIVLNTNIYYYNHEPLDSDDPCGQLAWFNQQVSSSSNESVFVLAHVPPGFFERDPLHPMFSVEAGQNITAKYLAISTDKANADKIVAHFYGHTHTDSFRLFTSGSDVPVGLAFLAPSITPGLWLDEKPYGVNPSFRTYSYDADSRTVMDYEQYYLPLDRVRFNMDRENVTEAEEEDSMVNNSNNSSNNNSDRSSRNSKYLDMDVTTTEAPLPSSSPALATSLLDQLVDFWTWGYRAQSAFNVTKLTRKTLHFAYVEMLHEPQGDMFRQFYKHNTMFHSASAATETCDDKCHKEIMCTVKEFFLDDMRKCLGLEQPVTPVRATTLPTLATSVDTPSPSTTRPTIVPSSTTVSTTPPSPTVRHHRPTSKPLRSVDSDLDDIDVHANGLRGIAVGFSVVMVISLAVAGLFVYRRLQRNRFRSQEFLLTDSVFRYDGYSQVDQP